jgi:hypothetical protein
MTPSVRKKNQRARVLSEVAIYPCIDNPCGLNGDTKVDGVLEFNPTKVLGERHDFTQSNGGLKP